MVPSLKNKSTWSIYHSDQEMMEVMVGLDNCRARLREMVSEVTIYSQGWIWWPKSSIHEVKVMLEKNRELRWVWWNITCSSNKRSIGSDLKASNDHPFDQELDDGGIECGRSEVCIRCASAAIWNRIHLKNIWNTSIVYGQLGMNSSGMEFENVERKLVGT